MTSLPGSVSSSTIESARDLQDRVARFALGVFSIGAVMGVASLATQLTRHTRTTEIGGVVHEILHFAVLAPSLAVWLRCRGDLMRVEVVQAIDAALTIALGTFYALLGLSAPMSLTVAFSVVLAVTYTLLGRSIIVSSSFRRTLWISVAGAAPTVAYFAEEGVPSAFAESPQGAHVFVAFGTLWCVIAVFAAAANSRQLYGLRARIREIGKLGQYTLEEKIGEGGMGAVYRATHAMLRRPAAIKLLSKDGASERDQARFEREVQLTSRLAHPNTISVFDYGRTADGVFYYVMEYLDGVDLERLVEEHGALDPARAIHILVQVCGALCEAHALGLVHRDIKPANVMLTERADEPDVVKVVDFGLVKTFDKSDGDSRTGAIAGTPMYMSPEAIMAPETVDGRADIYALGAVAYFLVAGRNVFEGATVVELLSKHMLETPRAPTTPLGGPVPSDLEQVILMCLAKDRGIRPQSAAALLAALLACKDAGRYDRDAACTWWRDHGPRSREDKVSVVRRSPTTMAVDFRDRRDPFV